MTPSPAQNSSKKSVGRPFKKGQSGNPGGRPKTAYVAELIREYFKAMDEDEDKTNLEVVLDNLKKHKPEILMYFVYGKPAEVVSMSGSVEVTGLPADVLARLREMSN